MYLFQYNLTHSYINSTRITRIIDFTGRSQVLHPDLLEKFQKFSLETGILPENIVSLPQNGMLIIQ